MAPMGPCSGSGVTSAKASAAAGEVWSEGEADRERWFNLTTLPILFASAQDGFHSQRL